MANDGMSGSDNAEDSCAGKQMQCSEGAKRKKTNGR